MFFSVFLIGIVLTINVCLNFTTVHCLYKFGDDGNVLSGVPHSYKNQQSLPTPEISSRFTPSPSLWNRSTPSKLQRPTPRGRVSGMSFPQRRSWMSKPNHSKPSSSNEDDNKMSDSTVSNENSPLIVTHPFWNEALPSLLRDREVNSSLRSRTSASNNGDSFVERLSGKDSNAIVPNEGTNKTSDLNSSEEKETSTNDNFNLEKKISEQLQPSSLSTAMESGAQKHTPRWNALNPSPKDRTQSPATLRPPIRSQLRSPPMQLPTHPYWNVALPSLLRDREVNSSLQSRTSASNNGDSFLERLNGNDSNAVASNEGTNKISDLTSSEEKQTSTIKDSHSRKDNSKEFQPSSSNTVGESVVKKQEPESNASQPLSQDQKQVVPPFKSELANLELRRSELQSRLNAKTLPIAYKKSNSENGRSESDAMKLPIFSNGGYLERRRNPTSPTKFPLARPLPINAYFRRSR